MLENLNSLTCKVIFGKLRKRPNLESEAHRIILGVVLPTAKTASEKYRLN